jgi:ubiquinone/menaquinone biosynthesis C-methylase UbiE
LNGKGTLLDLGCGTGELTVPLAPYFEQIIGLDPSPDMLAEARERQKRGGVANVKWVQKTAEEIDSSFGEIRLTTIGTAFHWMQQDLVLEKVYEQTQPSGGVAILFGSLSKWWEAHAPWQHKAKEIVQKYLGQERRAGEGHFSAYRQGNGKSEDALGRSAFKKVTSHIYQTSLTLNSEQILGRLYSSSWANKRYFGDKAPEFEKELKETLLALEPKDTFLEEGTAESYFALKL